MRLWTGHLDLVYWPKGQLFKLNVAWIHRKTLANQSIPHKLTEYRNCRVDLLTWTLRLSSVCLSASASRQRSRLSTSSSPASLSNFWSPHWGWSTPRALLCCVRPEWKWVTRRISGRDQATFQIPLMSDLSFSLKRKYRKWNWNLCDFFFFLKSI